MNKFFTSIKKTKPKEKTVHGVTVKKLPTGKYLEFMKAKPDLLVSVADELFPEGTSVNDILKAISLGSIEEIKSLIIKALAVVPEMLIQVLAELIEADPNYLLNSLTPKELLDVLKAFNELNDLSSFFLTVKNLLPKAKA